MPHEQATITVPIGDLPTSLRPGRVDVHLSKLQNCGARMLARALDESTERLADGTRVTKPAHAVKWLLEQIANSEEGQLAIDVHKEAAAIAEQARRDQLQGMANDMQRRKDELAKAKAEGSRAVRTLLARRRREEEERVAANRTQAESNGHATADTAGSGDAAGVAASTEQPAKATAGTGEASGTPAKASAGNKPPRPKRKGRGGGN